MTFTQSAETETQRIARGLRGRDTGLLSELVERYQYRLARYLLYFTGRPEFVEDLIQATQNNLFHGPPRRGMLRGLA